MKQILNIGRTTSVIFMAFVVLALPTTSAQAADLGGGSYSDYSYSEPSSDSYGSYSDYSYSDTSSGSYSDYSYTESTGSYSDYTYTEPSGSYSDYTYVDYGGSYSDYSYVPDYGCTYDCGGCTYDCGGCSYDCGGCDYNCGGGGCTHNCEPPHKPAPTCDLNISPSHVDYGDDATIHWSTTNASTVTLSSFGSVSKNGSKEIENIKSDRTYTLTVTGNGKTVTCHDSVKVEKEHKDLECKLKVSDSSIREGEKVKLTWSSEGADRGKITPEVGNVDEDGWEYVYPDEDTTYKGTFYSEDGDDKVTCSVKVRVDEDRYIPHTPYVTLSAVPYTGFELGPVGTAIYWTLLVVWCLIAAYLIAVKKAHVSIARRLNSFLFGTTTVVAVAPTAAAHVAHTHVAHTHTAHDEHTDSTDEFVLSQLNRGRHAH